jgi:hypothetical protein
MDNMRLAQQSEMYLDDGKTTAIKHCWLLSSGQNQDESCFTVKTVFNVFEDKQFVKTLDIKVRQEELAVEMFPYLIGNLVKLG